MAKLGQQVRAQEQSRQQQQQPTRTQRIRAQQEQARFERLSAEAEKVKQEQFKDKVVTREETYYEYRPKEYSEKEWNRMKDSSKQAILRQYERGRGLDYYADRGVLVKTARTRTVTETIPFTLDEGSNSYEGIYNSLSPELKQFFTPPETLKAERTARIQGNITQVDERIEMAKARLVELDAKYQQRKRELEEWWQRKSSEYRNDPRNRENYKQNQRDLEDDYEEDKEQQRGLIEGFQKGRGQLASQKDIDFNAIVDYANDLGNYYEERQDARNENRKAQQKAIKELEKRNAEAIAKGFTMTGTITESFVDPKTKKETVKGTKYYIGGAEVAPSVFGKQFDIYEKPSGGRLIVSKGTDLTKLSPEQQKKLFPVEYEMAEAQRLGKLQAFESKVESLPVTEQQAPAPQKSTFRKILDTTGDVLSGLFLKSTVGLGTRGFASREPTGLTGDELAQKREEALDKATIFGFTRGELVRGQPPSERKLSDFFGIGVPGLIDISGTQIEGYKLSKEIRESGETTIAQGNIDIDEITKGTTKLSGLNTRTDDIQQRLDTGKITPEQAESEFALVEQDRLSVFQDLAGKGIKTNIETDAEGRQSISFSSRALETDLRPASVKLLEKASTLQKVQLFSGGLATEALEFGTIGLATGGSGTLVKFGALLSKVPKLKYAVYGGTAILSGINIYKGQKGGAISGEELGIGKTAGRFLGASIPITQITAFAGGAYVGSQLYINRIVTKTSQGGFTKPVRLDQKALLRDQKMVESDKGVPGQVRGGKSYEIQGDVRTKVGQGDVLRTKIPGTDIKIDTQGVITGKFKGNIGRSQGLSTSKISGKDAGALRGTTSVARTAYFDQGEKGTGIVTFTKTAKGVRVDQFYSSTKLKDFKVIAEGADGGKTVFIDFNRQVTQLGQPFYVKGSTLSNKDLTAILRSRIDFNRLFTSFQGEDRLFTVGRYQQKIEISPKQIEGYVPTGKDTVAQVTSERFASIGSSRVARVDALKSLINSIMKQEGGVAFAKGLAMNKRGQVNLVPELFKPETVPTSVKVPQSVFTQDVGRVTAPGITSQIESAIRSALGSKALLGTSALIGVGSATRSRQDLTQRILQLQNLNLNQLLLQNQTPIQEQTPRQQQVQRQQQQLLQELQFQAPSGSGFTTPTTPTPSVSFPDLPDFDLEFFEQVKRKAKLKKSKKELFYVQDFPSKILDTQPVAVTEKQLAKLVKSGFTGFEARPPIVIVPEGSLKNKKRLKKLLSQY